MQQQQQHPPRVVLVPFPAQGHVTPMLHLARSLHARGFHVTLACPDYIYRRLTDKVDGRICLASIPSGLGGDGEEAASSSGKLADVVRAMENHMPAHLERWLRQAEVSAATTTSRLLMVVDLLASWAIPVADKLGVTVAGFWPAMLATYRLVSAIPELMQRGLISECGVPVRLSQRRQQQGEEEEQTSQEQAEEEIHLPGQAKLTTKHLPWLVGNAASQRSRFKFWLQILDRAKSLRWILVNSFSGEGSGPAGDIHCEHDAALLQPLEGDPKIFQVGPLMTSCTGSAAPTTSRCSPSMWDEDRSCLQWLDEHSPSSVLYVSFGSWVAPIAAEKIAELALGLEATGRPFLWVLRDEDSWRSGLPGGYLERVADRAKVIAWAPQEDVLRHRAVGCYLTHCGWNSTLEAIRHGKRLLCYPVSGDQFVNCAYIVKVWGIGMTPEGGATGRKAIGEAIRKIMAGEEGEAMQRRMAELKKRVMGRKGNATAAANLQAFIDDMQNNIKKLEDRQQ